MQRTREMQRTELYARRPPADEPDHYSGFATGGAYRERGELLYANNRARRFTDDGCGIREKVAYKTGLLVPAYNQQIGVELASRHGNDGPGCSGIDEHLC